MAKQKIVLEGEFCQHNDGSVSFVSEGKRIVVLWSDETSFVMVPLALVEATRERLMRTRKLKPNEVLRTDGTVLELSKCGVDSDGDPRVDAFTPFYHDTALRNERHYAPGSAERAQAYWLANYQFKPGEYFDDEKDARIAELEARLTLYKQLQPMETAPRDGTMVLLAGPDGLKWALPCQFRKTVTGGYWVNSARGIIIPNPIGWYALPGEVSRD